MLRWNHLATKIAETRTKIQQIRDRVAPYDYVPQYIYYKNTGEEITFYTGWDSTGKMPFWKPTQVPCFNYSNGYSSTGCKMVENKLGTAVK